uniref:Uncharacterized protein n=1 Tax=Amphimedon queenslandica TaxID=400682 RepID=A0A1X7URC9_AMPQE
MVLAGSGDKIHEDLLEVFTPQVSTVATSTVVEQISAEIAALKTLLESQQKQLSQRKKASRSAHHSRRSSPARPVTTQHQSTTLCWYHSRFQAATRICQPP